MSKIKAQLEFLFGAKKVRETPTGYRANASEIGLAEIDRLAAICEIVEDLRVKRSGTGVVVIVDVLK